MAIQSVAGLLRYGPSVAERVGSPNATCVQRNSSGLLLASFVLCLLDRQTLRVCAQVASDGQGLRLFVCLDRLETAKRYARNGFCACSRCSGNALKNQLNIKLRVAWRTSLSFPGRQTCVGVRPGDFVCLWHTMKNTAVSKSVSKCTLRCFADPRRSPNMRGCNVQAFVRICKVSGSQKHE